MYDVRVVRQPEQMRDEDREVGLVADDHDALECWRRPAAPTSAASGRIPLASQAHELEHGPRDSSLTSSPPSAARGAAGCVRMTAGRYPVFFGRNRPTFFACAIPFSESGALVVGSARSCRRWRGGGGKAMHGEKLSALHITIPPSTVEALPGDVFRLAAGEESDRRSRCRPARRIGRAESARPRPSSARRGARRSCPW